MLDSHMHTPFCKHARGLPEEFAKSAIEREDPLTGITFTCHSPPFEYSQGTWSPEARMSLREYPEYIDLLKKTANDFAGKIEIFSGLEVDFIPEPGVLDQLRGLLTEYPLDWILGSVHPNIVQYKVLYVGSPTITAENYRSLQAIYYNHLAELAEATFVDGTRMFDAVSHPDLIKIVRPADWNPEDILHDIIEPALDRIANTGIAVEINTSGASKAPYAMHPDPIILNAIAKRNIPVILGSDAHWPEKVGDGFDEALKLARKANIKSIIVPTGNREFETINITN